MVMAVIMKVVMIFVVAFRDTGTKGLPAKGVWPFALCTFSVARRPVDPTKHSFKVSGRSAVMAIDVC